MTEDKTYNGWTNYETWCVNLWLTNDEGSDSYWREAAEECKADVSDPNEYSADDGEHHAAITLADRIKGAMEDAMPTVDGMWSDLLQSSISEVNYYEIAKAFLED